MSDNEVILRLFTVALLVAFLIYKQAERARKRAAFRRQFQREGDVINVAPLRPRLEAVRRDYPAAAHVRGRGVQSREGLITAARRKLCRLPFFYSHPSEAEAQHRIG